MNNDIKQELYETELEISSFLQAEVNHSWFCVLYVSLTKISGRTISTAHNPNPALASHLLMCAFCFLGHEMASPPLAIVTAFQAVKKIVWEW